MFKKAKRGLDYAFKGRRKDASGNVKYGEGSGDRIRPGSTTTESPLHGPQERAPNPYEKEPSAKKTARSGQDGTVYGFSDNLAPEVGENVLQSSLGAAKTTMRSGMQHFSDAGNRSEAYRGIAKSTAANATLSGGVAAIQGEDMWEGAKSGAMRGAMMGTGYMGMKGAMGTQAKFGKGGMKEMGSTMKGTYAAHTAKGQSHFRDEGISKPLKSVLQNNKNASTAEAFMGKR